jgi:hypothetical protein
MPDTQTPENVPANSSREVLAALQARTSQQTKSDLKSIRPETKADQVIASEGPFKGLRVREVEPVASEGPFKGLRVREVEPGTPPKSIHHNSV